MTIFGAHADVYSFVLGCWIGALVMMLATWYDLKRRVER